MSRKQIVWIQWIAIAVAALVAFFCIRGFFFGKKARKTDQVIVVEEQTQTLSETAAPAEADTASGKELLEMQSITEEEASQRTSDGTSDSVRQYTFSFAGDCTIGSLVEWQGNEPGDFQSVVGTDYAYPLSGVRSIFSADDFTAVNLEGTFTNSEDAVDKPYRFKADPAYVQVLTEGSVEAVSASNNHSGDFQEEGLMDTLATLDSAGILYTRAGHPLIRELDGGLKIGIVSYNTVENWSGEDVWKGSVETDITACKEADCDLIIGFMHWGTVEYLTEPEDWEVEFAHDMAEWGCNLIVGGHAHILQRMEYYGDVPIFYSMGNFCYGGHLNPNDKDSVIVQAEYTWDPVSREVSRSGLRVIPCLISSKEDANDYCPTPCLEGSSDYQRILERLEWTEWKE